MFDPKELCPSANHQKKLHEKERKKSHPNAVSRNKYLHLNYDML